MPVRTVWPWPTQPSDGPTAAHWQDWSTALVEAGQRLGFIRTDGDRSLLATATAAVVRAADEWALAGLRAQQPQAQPQAVEGERVPDGGQAWTLLRGPSTTDTKDGRGRGRTDLTVDWTMPPTSPGPAGRLGRFMGPGESRSEPAVELTGAGGCALLLAAGWWTSDAPHDWTGLRWAGWS
ncbi:hypothetical protein [Streptomyces sp. NPDC047718]|uniref:hypothetical protein n=1 Tax=Streptomyces sp. NPDC047718 TaxID=3155479 RepID=UPI0033D2ED25